MKSSFHVGLKRLFAGYNQSTPNPLVASFEVVDLTHAPGAVNGYGGPAALTLSMRWKLLITDARGAIVLALAETTFGPKPIVDANEAEACLRVLEETVLERIADALNK